jgi:hypothetical protein
LSIRDLVDRAALLTRVTPRGLSSSATSAPNGIAGFGGASGRNVATAARAQPDAQAWFQRARLVAGNFLTD